MRKLLTLFAVVSSLGVISSTSFAQQMPANKPFSGWYLGAGYEYAEIKSNYATSESDAAILDLGYGIELPLLSFLSLTGFVDASLPVYRKYRSNSIIAGKEDTASNSSVVSVGVGVGLFKWLDPYIHAGYRFAWGDNKPAEGFTGGAGVKLKVTQKMMVDLRWTALIEKDSKTSKDNRLTVSLNYSL